MIALLFALAVDSTLRQGDHWITERTIRLIQEPDHVDQTSVDKLDYKVELSNEEGYVVSMKVTPGHDSAAKDASVRWSFKPNGLFLGKEDATDANTERINRMVWTALEDRKGLSWSRTWPAIGGLVGAEVIVKPASKTSEDITLSVSYKELGKVKAVATLKEFSEVRIVEDLALSINDVEIPGHAKTGSLVVAEKMKEIHLRPR